MSEYRILNRSGEELRRSAGGRAEVDAAVLCASGGKLTLLFRLPILDMHGVWKPDLFRPEMRLPWTVSLDCASNCNYPLLIFFNLAGINRFAFYSTDHCDDCRITAKMNQREGCYDFTAAVSISEETEPFSFVFDDEPLPWYEIPRRCRGPVPEFPAGAWEPVYCTWYAAHAALDMEFLERNARKAAELGFGTFIVDDGWSYDEKKRVTPESAGDWYRSVGDWRVSETKLPGFAGHVARARETGLNYLLWAAPFFLGADTAEYRECGSFLFGEPGSYGVFDPSDKVRSGKVIEQLRALVSRYELDGLKLDFLAHVPPDVESPHGRAAEDFIARLTDAIRAENPGALLEFRHFYSTPRMLRYATQFRANDTPFDFIENFHRVVQLRMLLGDQVPVHSDPACWHPEEKPENIARHLIASMAGVPMLSLELGSCSPVAEHLIRYYLGLYNAYKELFRAGRWRFRYRFNQAVWLWAEGAGERVVFLADKSCLPEVLKDSPAEMLLFNLDAEALALPPEFEIFDFMGNNAAPGLLPAAGSAKLQRK